MKTRITTDGKFFYPQCRGLFGWKPFYEVSLYDEHNWGSEVYFSTVEEARAYLHPKPLEVVV